MLAARAGSTARPLGAGCLLAAMPLRDSSCPVGAVPPYGWGVSLAGEIAFSFVGKRDVFTLRWFLPAQQGPQPSRWRLCRLTDGAYPLRVKPLFLLFDKRKSGSGLRKRKGGPVEMITGYGTTVQSPNPAGYSLGKILWAILLFSAAWV